MIKHIAFIMDGNRRFAKKNNLSLETGYQKGFDQFINFVKYQVKNNIFETSFFALSKENLENRSELEIKTLFKIINFFNESEKMKNYFNENNIRLQLKGNISDLKKKDKKINKWVCELEEENKKDKKVDFIVNIALNYNGQDEILHSFKEILKKQKLGQLKEEEISIQTIKENLYFNGEIPQIIVRTGDAPRLSGFMLWDSNYSEIFLSKKMWPELKEEDFLEILDWYKNIKRNFGK